MEIVNKAKEVLKTEELQRAYASILGAAVADASAASCHWQYDAQILADIVGDEDVAFWSGKNVNPFYKVAEGVNTCYGDQLVCVTESLATVWRNDFTTDLTKRFKTRFGESDDYTNAIQAKREYNYGYDQIPRSEPIAGPWIHGTIETFLADEISETDTSADALLRTIPIAAIFHNDDQLLLDYTYSAVVLTQRAPSALKYSQLIAKALADVILNQREPYLALQSVASNVNKEEEATVCYALDACTETYAESVTKLRATLPGYAETKPTKLLA
mmetsp:Transcript_21970/g.28457  ORF Transcript_21970/g.28457 Transcript_21970/m.28457 type:complete len:273 (+) Transcript_21970:42-860(+)